MIFLLTEPKPNEGERERVGDLPQHNNFLARGDPESIKLRGKVGGEGQRIEA